MKYKVGDKVRVRQWDDMVKEFGFFDSAERDIDIPGCTFVNSMKKFCNSVVTISSIECSNSRYLVEEDYKDWYWVDEMFEEICSESNDSIYAEGTMLKVIKTGYGCFGAEGKTGIVTSKLSTHGLESLRKGFNVLVSPDEIWRINVGAIVESIKPMAILPNPKHNDLLDSVIWISSKEENKRTVKETEEMMKENTTAEAKKRVHLKDEDHLKRVEKIQKKIDYYRNVSGFDSINEVVPNEVVKAKFYGREYKMVRDHRDVFSMKKVLYLVIAKHLYRDKYTSEGIEKKAEELKYEKAYVKKVEQAMKMLVAMKELEKENAEYEALLEARRQKRWERKQRQMDRRAEKKKAQEEKEREEKIQIQTEAYLRAMKAAKEEEKKEEDAPVKEENAKVESKQEENMTEITKESTEESTENTEETATTTE